MFTEVMLFTSMLAPVLLTTAAQINAFITNGANVLGSIVAGVGGCLVVSGIMGAIEGYQEDSASAKSKGWKTIGVGAGTAILGLGIVTQLGTLFTVT